MPIEIKNLSHTYMKGTAGARKALKSVSFTIDEGEFWGIIGHTGSGKSTLLQHIGGIMPPEEGTVIVDGYDFSDKKQRIEGRKKVGLVFQYPEYQLFEETVAKDIAYGPTNMKLPGEEIDARVHEAMALMGLAYDKFAEKSPFELSGGEKRRAALAGIIAMKPRYLVLDEPMAGLDPAGRKAILETLEGIRRDTGCAVIMVSHSMEDVARHSRKIAVMDKGTLAAIGTPEEVFGGSLPLEELGLDLPEVSHLGMLLREKGMDIPPVYTVEGMRDHLLGRAKNV
ncbi:MAG: energy-coupling factor transporter ATPase [Clostridia bacterium]|nr:energy-coupling factor transporter ATPase [Clostridia bacterium]